MRIPATLLAMALLTAPLQARADAALQGFLEQTLKAAQEKDHLPGVAAMIQINGRTEAQSAIDVRAMGHPEKVTLRDRWHLGSDTKAITATMIARLVEKGLLRFDDTLAVSFPAYAQEMNPVYRSVTIAQLLSHTAGLPTLTEDKDLPEFNAVIAKAAGVVAQRAAIARNYLSQPPASKPGEFAYSNIGFIIAGAIAEVRTGKSWETLVRKEVFAPLGIRHAGFGVPGRKGKYDQPWGHKEVAGALMAIDPSDPEGDNPPALGPAGTINMPLADWMRFAQDQLEGVHGRGKLLNAATYRQLHTPVAGNYAYGWGAKLGEDGVPLLLTHSGSNGFWLADVRIMPRHDMIFLVVTNAGNDAANAAIMDIGKPLKDRLKPFD